MTYLVIFRPWWRYQISSSQKVQMRMKSQVVGVRVESQVRSDHVTRVHASAYTPYLSVCLFVIDALQVRSPGQWWSVPNLEFWTCSVPHSVQNCVGAVERVLCDGHAGHEEGERSLCCPARCLSVFTGSYWHTYLMSGCFRRRMKFLAATWVASSDRVLSLLLLLCPRFTEVHLRMVPSFPKHR